MTKIGIIGGSGLENPKFLRDAADLEVNTDYGNTLLKAGIIGNNDVVLLARHGKEHTIPPSQVNYRANIQALKKIGCTHILATTACGSLRKDIGRGDLVILDQFIDFTRQRKTTFHEVFQPGKAVHTPMAEPFDPEMRKHLIAACEELGLRHHPKGTVVTIEGPRFSTKAESRMFRLLGADVVNMSLAPEAILANEAGIPYAAIAMSTDYDCLFDDLPPVTWEDVLKVFKENVDKVTKLLFMVISRIETCGQKPMETFQEERRFDQREGEDCPEEGIDLTAPIIKSSIRTVPHWPKPGIMFRDITTLLLNPDIFNLTIQKFKEHYQNQKIDKVAGIESRGFVFGAALARELNLPFILIRKKGKLPAETAAQEYELEYGTDRIEMHKDAVISGEKVLIIDDLLATGGTMLAACKLVEKLGGKVSSCACVINLPELKGKEKLSGYDLFNLVEFEGR